MGMTNFGMLTPDNIKAYQKEIRHEWLAKSFLLPRLCGEGDNFPIEKITTLKRTPGGGSECIMTLVPNLTKDGGVGSAGGKREGMEEKMNKFTKKIQIDEMFHTIRHEGELEDQDTVVDFRKEAKNGLTNWLSERTDDLLILTASGISYAYNVDGSLRAEDTFTKLRFASDVAAPTSKRFRRWNGTAGTLDAGDTSVIAATDVPSYKMLLMAKAYARTHKIFPLQAGGKYWYVVLLTPYTLAQLKNDTDYKNAVINGGVRGDDNPFFTGGIPTIDGLILMECDKVYNTNGTATKWGAGNAINGSRTLLMGSKGLGFADVSEPKWVEDEFEYKTQPGIMLSKFQGILKPSFYSTFDKSTEDTGILCIDHFMLSY
jgi:N4-gp56 family major capsid protein